ncbi:hypothetical protein LINPERHAP1_LOCUS17947 [Linum perenne]
MIGGSNWNQAQSFWSEINKKVGRVERRRRRRRAEFLPIRRRRGRPKFFVHVVFVHPSHCLGASFIGRKKRIFLFFYFVSLL